MLNSLLRVTLEDLKIFVPDVSEVFLAIMKAMLVCHCSIALAIWPSGRLLLSNLIKRTLMVLIIVLFSSPPICSSFLLLILTWTNKSDIPRSVGVADAL